MSVMSHDPLADLDQGASPATEGSADSADVDAVNADIVHLGSSLTIAAVGESYGGLLQRLNQGSPLQIDGGAVEVIDGAGVQLLMALVKEAIARGIPVGWTQASDSLLRAARTLGVMDALTINSMEASV